MLPTSPRPPLTPLAPAALARLLEDLRSGGPRTALARVRSQDCVLEGLRHAAPDRYTRFELAATTRELVVLIVWLPGQFSPAHDHGGSHCIVRILQGVATEQRYEVVGDDRVTLIEEDRFLPGSIVSCDGEDIHAMGNDEASSEPLVTLHVYRPRPLMREYRIVSGVSA